MGPDVHFGMTLRWGLEEGLPLAEAEAIAGACAAFDTRFPARRSLTNVSRHFAPWAWVWSARYRGEALRSGSAELLGWAIHCAQDAVAHGRLGLNHLLYSAWLRRDPDAWGLAPARVKRGTEAVSRRILRAWRVRASTSGRSGEVGDDEPHLMPAGE